MLAFGSSSLLSPLSMSVYERGYSCQENYKGESDGRIGGGRKEGREARKVQRETSFFLSFFTERVRRRKPSERGAVHSDRGQEQSNFIRVGLD